MSAETINVPCYGIHWTGDGIAFLEQGGPRGGSNALGLAVKSPFRVRIEGRNRQCNHNVPLAAPNLNAMHAERFIALAQDPLVRAMCPIPKDSDSTGLWYIDDAADELGLYLALLSRMSSPVYGVVSPIWTAKQVVIFDELKRTNVQPLVLTGVQPKHTELLAELAKAAAFCPRSFIVTGGPEVVVPKQAQRITTEISKLDLKDLLLLPWEAFGATVVRRFMRGEI